MSEQFPQDITQPLTIPFTIRSFGIYALKVVASCQFSDLRIEIDSTKLREIPPQDRSQYNNIPPAWNGTELKGLNKTIVFILALNKGFHILTCIPTNGARIEFFEVKVVENIRNIVFEENKRAEEGDRRPWYTFALVNLPLQSLTVDISVSWHFLDGDDVKLIIDNKIEENLQSKRWKYWVWSAKPWFIFSGAKREQKTFVRKLSPDTHYIEFWADKTPTFHKVTLDLGEFQPKRIPDGVDPEWTGDFIDDPEDILLARLIFGESADQSKEAKIWTGASILNRVKSLAWPGTVHEVILQKGQYDPFKISDVNFGKITNPLRINEGGELQVSAWKESYDIARKLISSETSNPTTATHFHGRGVTPEWFIEYVVPEGRLLKKIDDTYFYWSPN